ncbi:SPW repeat-containing protein [Bordetella sputigena]|uniref:SPW repeat protein n=1 Tax=Bordetella sputigena TaxID=1416810 RepID=UPI0039EE9AB3
MSKQRWQDWVTTLAGAYLFFSPWIISYFSPSSTITGAAVWSHYVVGVVIVAIGLAALASYQLWEEWVEVALGIWLVIAPWILGFPAVKAFAWSSIVVGIVVIAMAAAALARMKVLTQRGA